MKKSLFLALLTCFTITAVILVGCAGGASSSSQSGETPDAVNKVTPDVEKFVLDAWDVEITNAEVLYDESEGYDNLVIYTKATNTIDKELKFDPNVVTTQNDEYMGVGNIKDADGKLLLTSNDDLPFCKKGESCERVFTYQIEDYETPVVSNFGGYTVAVEDTIVTFDISGKQTDEAKKVADERQAELDQQKAISSVEFDQAAVTVPEGWMVETSTAVSCQLKPEEDSGYVLIETQTSRSAAEARDALNSNFNGEKPLDEVEINGVTWLRLTVNDTQVHLFADAPAGGAVHMSSMHFTYDEALPIFECVTLK